MRNHKLQLEEYGISKWEYYELKAFCRQYDAKRSKAADALSLHGQDLSGDPKPNLPTSPIETAAARREVLLKDIHDIETAAEKAGGGNWQTVLIENCCRGISYERLDKTKMPTSKRYTFYLVRREFFYLLSKLRGG